MTRRELPAHPDLSQYRKQAKDLFKAAKAGDAEALSRFAEIMPSKQRPSLADAQFVLAREHGFENWAAFREKIESLQTNGADPVEAFKQSIRDGDAAALKMLLKRHPKLREQVNAPLFDFGARAIAAAKTRRDVVDVLLKHGADINLKSDWWAGPWGILENTDPETAEFLISRGAVVDVFAAASLGKLDRLRELLESDPSLVHAKGGDGCRPLHYARSKEMIDLLLEHGADIDARCVDHEGTAAQWILPRAPGNAGGANGDLEIVRYLIDRGATCDIFMAAALGDVDLLREVIARDPSSLDARVGDDGYALCPKAPGEHIYVYTLGARKTPHQVAAHFGNAECVELLLEYSTPAQRFLSACAMADEAAARSMLRSLPKLVQSLDAEQLRLLPDCAGHGLVNAVRLMLEMGFPVDAKGMHGGTALHQAAWFGHLPVIELLLLHHPQIEPLDDDHRSTPLGWCCHGSTHCRNPAADYAGIAKALLAAGARPGPNLADATPEVRAVIERHGP